MVPIFCMELAKSSSVLSNLWLFSFPKSVLQPLHHLEYLVSNLVHSPNQNFHSSRKYCLFNIAHRDPLTHPPIAPSVCFCVRVLGLTLWNNPFHSLDCAMHLFSHTSLSLTWWISNSAPESGSAFLPMLWKLATTDTSWGLGVHSTP